MTLNGWMYYNHAAIPTVAPHENPDLSPVEDGTIWKINGGLPLLARWTTDFDCGYETNWWYLIKEAPVNMEELPAKERKSIRQALKKSYVRKINPTEYTEDLYRVYVAAVSKYENATFVQTKDDFAEVPGDGIEYWAAFDMEADRLIGYMVVQSFDVYAQIQTTKLDPDFLKLRVSDAMYCTVLEHYLNECKKRYVSSGARNINHKTGTEEYKIRRFGYRKAYCHLHIAYNPKIKPLIKMLYPFRKILAKIDRITLIHKVNAVLLMEELIREKVER